LIVAMCAIAGAHWGCAPNAIEADRVSSIQVLGFSGCPNTPELLYRVKFATIQSGLDVPVVYQDQQDLGESDVRRGYPAPTVLVDGHDLFGLPTPTSLAAGCRLYVGGLPGILDIQDRLLAANQSR
jgi:hypothetical protein